MGLGSSQQNDKLVASLAAFFVVFAAFGGGAYARADVAFKGQVLDYQAKQIYHSPETPGYTSWVGLWQLPNGRLRCDFNQITGPTTCPVSTVPVLESLNGGGTWNQVPTNNPTVPAGTGPYYQYGAGCCRGMAVLPNGTLVRPVRPPDAELTGNAQGYVERSTDGGTTWGDKIFLVSADEYRVTYPTLIKPLRDGRLVAFAAVVPKNVPSQNWQQNFTKTMVVSSDGGQTWGSPITLMPASTGVCEESDFVELSNGDLIFISRAGHYSDDGAYLYSNRLQTKVKEVGQTFVPNPTTTLSWPHSGCPCELMTKEGVILDLCTTGSHWSADNGQTWHNLMVGGQQLNTYYYPQAVQAADGTIVVISHVGGDDVYGTVDQSVMAQTFRLSPVEMPEPSTLTLLGIGALGLLAYAWRRCWHGV